MKLTDRQVRGWLTNIYSPGALADPEMRDVLQGHGRPSEGTSFQVAQEARHFLQARIERLQPEPGSPEQAWRPYRVLVLSFLEGHSFYNVARLMGLSSRQLTREREQAVRLLREELETPAH